MIVLFEGFDRCGKSEIANELSKQLDLPYYKCQVEQGAFNGSFIPEQALIYEVRQLIELIEQDVFINIIIDRNYVSEFSYGYLVRNGQYEALKSEEYIWKYDQRFYPLDLTIIYCYKTEHKNYDDEHVKLELKERIENRYKLFIDKTINPVLMLDTTDENLKNQVSIINEFLIKQNTIKKLNKSIAENSYPPLNILDNGNIYSSLFLPGIFYGDEILFIGQNPGQPHLDDAQSIAMHKTRPETWKSFEHWELEHHLSYRRSKFYKFMAAFAKNNFDLNSKQWSFTNIVKYATIDNETPIVSPNDEYILKRQINALKPKRIISFGKQAHQSLEKMEIHHEPYYHPSYFNYSKTEPML